jgi:RNA recognition motif-containing protein
MLPKNGNPQEITNPLGLKALFVRNVNRNVKDIEVRVVFERFGSVIKFKHFNEKSRSAFVCFGSAEVATRAMKTLYYFSDQRLCHDPAIPWMFRFAPTDDQRDEPSLKSPQVMRQTVERCGECYDWRVGERCQRSPCPFIHIPINRNIDSKTTDAQAKRQR